MKTPEDKLPLAEWEHELRILQPPLGGYKKEPKEMRVGEFTRRVWQLICLPAIWLAALIIVAAVGWVLFLYS